MEHRPDQLVAFRKARNWTQPRLAAELGVHLATVVRWETRKTEIKPYVFSALDALSEKYPPVSEPAE